MHWLDSLHMYLCNIIKQLWLRSESHFIQPCLCLCNHYFLLEAHAWWTDNEGHYNSAVELNNNQSKRWMRTLNLTRSRYLNLCVLSPDLSREICINLCVCLCLSFQKEAWHYCEVSDPMSWIFMNLYYLSASGPSLCHLYQRVSFHWHWLGEAWFVNMLFDATRLWQWDAWGWTLVTMTLCCMKPALFVRLLYSWKCWTKL